MGEAVTLASEETNPLLPRATAVGADPIASGHAAEGGPYARAGGGKTTAGGHSFNATFTTARTRTRWQSASVPRAWVVLPRVAGVVVAVVALWYGWHLRSAWFASSGDVRFRWDIQNALNQSNAALTSAGLHRTPGQRPALRETLAAWVQRYDRVVEQAGSGRRYSLDYTPLRLLVMMLWVRELWSGEGPVDTYTDAMGLPLMTLNSVCGLLTAAGVFWLIRFWLIRASPPIGPNLRPLRSIWLSHRAWSVALAGALLVWLNLTLLLNAHVFPQWDVWLLPFFVFGALGASVGGLGWLLCGILLAVGAMFKGQILLVAPVLVVWAIASDPRGGNLVRLMAGLAAGAALVTWPWLVRSWEPVVWGAGMLAGTLAMAATSIWSAARGRGWNSWLGGGLSSGAGAVLAGWTLYSVGGIAWWAVTLAGGAVGYMLWRKPWRTLPVAIAGAFALAVLGGGWRFGGSWSWYEVGFRFPTDNYQALAMGTTANLPAILQQHYGWKLKDEVTVLGHPVTLQVLLRWVYAVLVIPVGWMAAMYARRNDPRVLLCLAAPWVLMFAVLPQMHERYLIWGSVLTALGVAAVSGPVGKLGMLGLHGMTTAAGSACVGILILFQRRGWWPEMERALTPAVPAVGWAVVVVALIYWFLCFQPPISVGRDEIAESA